MGPRGEMVGECATRYGFRIGGASVIGPGTRDEVNPGTRSASDPGIVDSGVPGGDLSA